MTTLTKSRIRAGITQAATMLLTVLAWVAAQGSNPLAGLIPDSAWQWVTIVAALLLGVWNGWKNQNWSAAAVAAQSLLDHIKAGVGTEDQPGTTWYGTEAIKSDDDAAASTTGDASCDVTPDQTDVTPTMTGTTLPTGTTAEAAA